VIRLCPVVSIRQHFPSRALSDIVCAVRTELAAKEVGAGLAPGARVALGAGSRGIANLATIVRATVGHFRDRGLDPFIVTAMGSHGGGTPQGQIDVLAHYGVTAAEMGCEILSSIEVVPLGTTPEGFETFLDRNAFESSGAFVINRVKWHTTFDHTVESGLTKMTCIGLGKVAGATKYHEYGVRHGLGQVIQAAGRHVLASGRILGGLAILEDARHQTAQVTAVAAGRMEEEEPQLLAMARSWMPRIPFDEVDLLIVDEIGKQISGVGMDSKVVNRHPYGGVNPWPWAPRIRRIYVRDLSDLSYGNAVGIGMADMISARLYAKVDWDVTRVNALAASNLASSRTPFQARNDREALETLAATVGRQNSADVTCVRIRNTLELAEMRVTENLLAANGDLEVMGPPLEWRFDADGTILDQRSASS